jgi:metal-responsive CopG/Arc/MetJ family transcriptional regulator
MKTAISIPDALFKRAERTAKAIGVSRSRLFTMAVESFLAHRNPSQVTETLNRIYSDPTEGLDERISKMQTKSLARETW